MGRRVHPEKRSVSWVNSVLRQFLPHGPTAARQARMKPACCKEEEILGWLMMVHIPAADEPSRDEENESCLLYLHPHSLYQLPVSEVGKG